MVAFFADPSEAGAGFQRNHILGHAITPLCMSASDVVLRCLLSEKWYDLIAVQ